MGDLRAMSLTATLLASLELIRHELTKMQIAVDDSREIAQSDRHDVKMRVTELEMDVDLMLDWLGEQRLEERTN